RDSLTICTSDMLACVLQGMTKRTRKARFLAGVLLARRMVQFLALDEYTPWRRLSSFAAQSRFQGLPHRADKGQQKHREHGDWCCISSAADPTRRTRHTREKEIGARRSPASPSPAERRPSHLD